MVYRLVGAVVVDLLAVQRDGAAGLLTDAEQGLHDVGAFSAHQAGDTENFARFCRERNVIQYFYAVMVLYIQTFDFQPVLAIFGRAAFDIERHFLAHHQFGEFVFVGVFRSDFAHGFALS